MGSAWWRAAWLLGGVLWLLKGRDGCNRYGLGSSEVLLTRLIRRHTGAYRGSLRMPSGPQGFRRKQQKTLLLLLTFCPENREDYCRIWSWFMVAAHMKNSELGTLAESTAARDALGALSALAGMAVKLVPPDPGPGEPPLASGTVPLCRLIRDTGTAQRPAAGSWPACKNNSNAECGGAEWPPASRLARGEVRPVPRTPPSPLRTPPSSLLCRPDGTGRAGHRARAARGGPDLRRVLHPQTDRAGL